MQTKSRYFDKSILHRRSFFDKSFLSGIFPAQKKELLDEQFFFLSSKSYLFRAMEISTATATVAPTMGLLHL